MATEQIRTAPTEQSGAPLGDTLERWPLSRFKPYERNPREHTDEAIAQLALAIATFGFRVPVLARGDGTLVDGHLRLLAFPEAIAIPNLKPDIRADLERGVPVRLVDDMSVEALTAFRVSVNRMAELATWDEEKLLGELDTIATAGEFDLGADGAVGFDLEQVDAKPELEAWDMTPTKDLFVVTIKGSLPLEAEVRERLRGLDGVTVEASVVQQR